MLNNVVSLPKIDICKTGKGIAVFVAVFAVLTLAINSTGLAAGKVKASGTFTSIEEDGTVIIDKKGYDLSPSVVVLDYRGNKISLKDLPAPSYVKFEYEYTPRGFVVIFLKEVAR